MLSGLNNCYLFLVVFPNVLFFCQDCQIQDIAIPTMRNSLSVLLSSWLKLLLRCLCRAQVCHYHSSVYPYRTVPSLYPSNNGQVGAYSHSFFQGVYSLYRCNTNENGLGQVKKISNKRQSTILLRHGNYSICNKELFQSLLILFSPSRTTDYIK